MQIHDQGQINVPEDEEELLQQCQLSIAPDKTNKYEPTSKLTTTWDSEYCLAPWQRSK